MSYQELLELVVDLMVKRDRWEWGESEDEFTHQDAQALRHMNRILWDMEDEMMQGHEDDEQKRDFSRFYWEIKKFSKSFIFIA